MKYAFIEYEREKKSRVSEWAVSFIKPFTAENINVFGCEGVSVKINVRKDADDETVKRAVKKTQRFLVQNDVAYTAGEEIEGIPISDGRTLMALMAFRYADFSKRVAVLCGERNITDIVLCALCPRVRSISLYGYRGDSAETDEYFFKEYGINIQHIKKTEYRELFSADLVVDCRKEGKTLGGLKKYAYVSLSEEAQKPQKWLFDGEKIEFSPKGTELTADKAECVLRVMSDDFLKLSDEGICIEEKLKIAENMGMSALTSH